MRFAFTCERALRAGDVLVLPWRREGAMLTVTWEGEAPVTRFAQREGRAIRVELAEYLAGSGSFVAGASRYTRLGVEHILAGLDHLLFVLALLFVVRSGWKLVQTITAFTLAHSITLGLATLGYVHLPSAPVEAAIALSIVFLCVEIVHAQQGRTGLTFAQPWVVAFAFGLLHGLGFAGALSEIGLRPPRSRSRCSSSTSASSSASCSSSEQSSSWPRCCARPRASRADAAAVRSAERVAVYAMGVVSSYWLLERVTAIFA